MNVSELKTNVVRLSFHMGYAMGTALPSGRKNDGAYAPSQHSNPTREGGLLVIGHRRARIRPHVPIPRRNSVLHLGIAYIGLTIHIYLNPTMSGCSTTSAWTRPSNGIRIVPSCTGQPTEQGSKTIAVATSALAHLFGEGNAPVASRPFRSIDVAEIVCNIVIKRVEVGAPGIDDGSQI